MTLPRRFVTVDFETEAIAPRRPQYPPRPVSVAIKRSWEKHGKFLAWGHPEGNTCTKEEARRELLDVWKSSDPLLMQHGKFDLDVAETHLALPPLPWERTHDTEYLLFLDNPHSRSLSLKPNAARLLGAKLSERDALREWLVEKGIVKKNQKDWGAYIAKAPASVVGPYALDGDVAHTEAIFRKLYPAILERGMGAAYDRERRLMPVLLKAERGGIRADLRRLRRDVPVYLDALEKADRWIRQQLAAPGLNIDQDKELGEALARAGMVTEWTWTAGGNGRPPQRSVAKDSLTIDKFKNYQFALVYAYRVRLSTCIRMFALPWLEAAEETGGVIYYNINQVRQDRHGGNVGTRTGRLSSDNPNFYNVSKNFEEKDDGYKNPTHELKIAAERILQLGTLNRAFMTGERAGFLEVPGASLRLPPLPLMREYLLPDPGEVWGHRDWNQQELRLLAHFEGADMMKRYQAEPRWDIHTTVQDYLRESIEISLSRGGTKILNFADIYGRGLGTLAEALKVSVETAKLIRKTKNALMPGVESLSREVKVRGETGGCIRTWGGREYYAEPALEDGRSFAYKLLNYLIQGSAADVDKEALILYDEHPKREARFMVTVYDEVNASMAPKRVKLEMEILREVMEGLPNLDVPLLSDGKTGPSWGKLKKWED